MRSAGLRAFVGEHLLLDFLDVVVDALDDRLVVVHDLVDDRVAGRRRCRSRAAPARSSRPLRALVQRARLAVADRDHERAADEDVDLAGLDDLVGVDVAGRLEDHEQRVVVDLELRALVRLDRVLDRQLVKAELPAHRVELLGLGLEQPEPHERAVTPACLARRRGA